MSPREFLYRDSIRIPQEFLPISQGFLEDSVIAGIPKIPKEIAWPHSPVFRFPFTGFAVPYFMSQQLFRRTFVRVPSLKTPSLKTKEKTPNRDNSPYVSLSFSLQKRPLKKDRIT